MQHRSSKAEIYAPGGKFACYRLAYTVGLEFENLLAISLVDLRLRSNETSRPAPPQDRPRCFQNTL
jgi:hypothetical protein